MTPTQHAAAVDAFLARAQNPQLIPPMDTEVAAAEIHARLSVAAGTGTAYTQADTLLADAESKPIDARHGLLQTARIHALRAER